MDDNNEKPDENQPINDRPVFETVPVEDTPPVEEIPAEINTPEPTSFNAPSSTYQENKNQYFLIIGGAVIFFFVIIFVIKSVFFGKTVKKPINLIYWGLWEENEIFSPLINQYQQLNPNVKITYQKMDQQDYRDKLIARSKNQQGPDIFRYHNTWLPEIKEVVSSIPPSVMSNSEFEKTFYPVQQKDLKVGNYYYGIPLEIDGLVLFYNNNMFKKAGISIVPTTWDDITEIVPKLTVKDATGKLITSGIAIGTTSNIEHFSDIFGLLLMQNGGSLSKIDQSEGAGALEIYRKFAESPQNYWSDEMPNSITAFIQEKVAMIIAPSWEAIQIKNANPDIDMKIVPVPSVPGTSPLSLASYWVEGVSRYSTNQIEAWKFLKYLVEKENLTKLYELESKVRPFGEPYSRVDLANLLIQNQYIGAVISSASNYVSIPIISRTFDNGLNDNIIQYIENAVNSTIQGVSYSEALKAAKKGIDQIFVKYNISY